MEEVDEELLGSDNNQSTGDISDNEQSESDEEAIQVEIILFDLFLGRISICKTKE